MAERLRDQCPNCPWRNIADEVSPAIVEHAKVNPDGFVCHMRMGPCDGPRIALKMVRSE